jgi:hypothetical protein
MPSTSKNFKLKKKVRLQLDDEAMNAALKLETKDHSNPEARWGDVGGQGDWTMCAGDGSDGKQCNYCCAPAEWENPDNGDRTCGICDTTITNMDTKYSDDLPEPKETKEQEIDLMITEYNSDTKNNSSDNNDNSNTDVVDHVVEQSRPKPEIVIKKNKNGVRIPVKKTYHIDTSDRPQIKVTEKVEIVTNENGIRLPEKVKRVTKVTRKQRLRSCYSSTTHYDRVIGKMNDKIYAKYGAIDEMTNDYNKGNNTEGNNTGGNNEGHNKGNRSPSTPLAKNHDSKGNQSPLTPIAKKQHRRIVIVSNGVENA